MNATEKDLLAVKLNRTLLVKAFAAIGSLLGRLLPFRNGSSIFFFFPFHHVGGAEKVHAEIVNCFSAERPWVFFTKKSSNSGFLSLFGERAALLNMWQLLKYGYPVSIGIMAGFINRHKDPVVCGSNSLFYYLLLPYLSGKVRCVDIMHAFGGGSEDFSLSVAGRLDARVAINSKTVADFEQQYVAHGLPPSLTERVVLIENCVSVPASYREKGKKTGLKLLYVGRGSEEKRVHLVGRIAARCRREALPVEIVIAGDALQAVSIEDRPFCDFLGEISNPSHLEKVYDDADLLLLTSSREGFPMVIMEAMAHGVVPISTAVGGIPIHVQDGANGWLVRETADEDQVVDEMCGIIARMCSKPELVDAMSRAAYGYAREHFAGERFCAAYRSLLLGPAPQRRAQV